MEQSESQTPRDSLFSSDTIQGLHDALRDARGAADANTPQGMAEIVACEQVSAAVSAADAGQTDKARSILLDALTQSNDIRLLYLAFQFFFRHGDYDEAEQFVKRRLEACCKDSDDEARAWNNYGLIQFFRGDLDRAEELIRRALAIDTRIGNEQGISRDLGNLSLVPEARKDYDAAERLNRESLSIAERIGFLPVVASRLCNLGEIALARGNKCEAKAFLQRSQAIHAQLEIEKYRSHCEKLVRQIEEEEGRAAS